ncbi:TIGR02186 family protein [Aestuariibius sp. HNIBRBA575]|uniref:TIGR02186 family protein n=1 Tax=Aestuariibius sp. HNIBRBA575 TaxID=3233343 RepID=UPI0034A36245
MFLRLLALITCLTSPLAAEEIVLGLSQNEVAITANFDGKDILIFGAIKRETPISNEGPLEVIVTVSGPSEPVTVRRKAWRYGIWINTAAVDVDAAPSFYAVATTNPIQQVLSDVEDLRHKVTIPRAIRSVGAPMDVMDSESFTEALIRIRGAEDSYQLLEGAVDLDQDTLFRTAISLPANLTAGDYVTRIFLTRNGQVIDQYETPIAVQKVGLERFLFNLAHENPFLYGLMSLTIAIAAGWGASAAFRAFQR